MQVGWVGLRGGKGVTQLLHTLWSHDLWYIIQNKPFSIITILYQVFQKKFHCLKILFIVNKSWFLFYQPVYSLIMAVYKNILLNIWIISFHMSVQHYHHCLIPDLYLLYHFHTQTRIKLRYSYHRFISNLFHELIVFIFKRNINQMTFLKGKILHAIRLF